MDRVDRIKPKPSSGLKPKDFNPVHPVHPVKLRF
jgi:hypothetical protein